MRRASFHSVLLSIFLLCPLLHGSMAKEKTLAIIKPDGVAGNYTNKIKTVILESGFTIVRDMVLQLDEGNATHFYTEHSGKSFFPKLITYMTSGPVYLMVLEKVNAVSDWRNLIGPTDARKAKVSHPTRAMCGVDLERNCVHGSDSTQSAAREISIFFGKTSTGNGHLKHDEL
ncbi:probable nucleoside diphosphate kinase 5 isoform X2 [Aristolochia californica]|uniref:probable nucleoside diphosphate kinase 5 isoform X2 n=1 Tax=Aristolochia californica TaxID=171875 RepID=UPI0035D7AFA0